MKHWSAKPSALSQKTWCIDWHESTLTYTPRIAQTILNLCVFWAWPRRRASCRSSWHPDRRFLWKEGSLANILRHTSLENVTKSLPVTRRSNASRLNARTPRVRPNTLGCAWKMAYRGALYRRYLLNESFFVDFTRLKTFICNVERVHRLKSAFQPFLWTGEQIQTDRHTHTHTHTQTNRLL